MKTITLIIPAYNEEEVLDKLYKRLDNLSKSEKKYNFEFLFVNDGSKDKTLEIIEEYSKKDDRITYINLSRNFGKEIAMIAGLDYAVGDAVAIIDADLQDPPELLSEMIKYFEKGYDDVYAKRLSRAGESFIKRQTSSWFYRILQKSTSIQVQRDSGDYRLMSRRFVDALKEMRESERYTKGMFSWVGFKKKEITYNRDPRIAGKTKWNYLKLINLAINGVTSFTIAPLKIASLFGIIISFIAFIYILFLIFKTLFYGSDLAGYPSMMAVILFLGGVQLISLGIMGEYIGRIFNESKKRPLYFIDKIHQKNKLK